MIFLIAIDAFLLFVALSAVGAAALLGPNIGYAIAAIALVCVSNCITFLHGMRADRD